MVGGLRYYILEGRRAVLVATEGLPGQDIPSPDFLTWARWYETADRQVARDELPFATVSTVFLGMDHNIWGSGRPLIFETMVFAHPALEGEMKDFCGRCSTWEEAEAMHRDVMERLLQGHMEAAG